MNHAKLPGQTNTTLALGAATTNLDGAYSVTVSNVFGAQTSSNAVLTVDPLTSAIKEKLAVLINPAKAGSVSPNLNGKSLLVSHAYTITAVAGKGHAFANWTGLVQSDDPSVTFVMPDISNATLTANFIPSPFASNGVAGAYAGLFLDTNNPSNDTSGYFAATVAGGGIISGQVKIAGVSTGFSTTLRADGSATLELKRAKQSSLVLTLQIDLSGLETITGAVSDTNDTFNAALTAFRAGFGASHPATGYEGYYAWAMSLAARTSKRPGELQLRHSLHRGRWRSPSGHFLERWHHHHRFRVALHQRTNAIVRFPLWRQRLSSFLAVLSPIPPAVYPPMPPIGSKILPHLPRLFHITRIGPRNRRRKTPMPAASP